MTDTVEQVRKAVAASRYPPLRLRRCAAGLICVSRYGAADDFITTAHDELFIALQFEPIKGAENTEKIAAVEGVGMVFIGANGLSTRKPLETIPRPDADYSRLVEDGFLMVAGSSDTNLFHDAAKAEIAAYRDGVAKLRKQ